MTYKEAIKIADKMRYASIVGQVIEFPDRFVVSYVDENGDSPDISPIYVSKKDGRVGTFFPPDYEESYFDKGKIVYETADLHGDEDFAVYHFKHKNEDN